MNKREFLSKLNEYLSYELPESMVREKLEFYSSYIDSESKNGKDVMQVVDELGDPQLIARSIIDAAKSGPDGIPGTDDDIDFGDDIASNRRRSGQSGYGSYGSTGRTSAGYGSSGASTGNSGAGTGGSRRTVSEDGSYAEDDSRSTNSSPWGGGVHVYNMGCFTGVLIFLIIFSLFSMAGALLGFLKPILAPICIFLLIIWLIGRRKDKGGWW